MDVTTTSRRDRVTGAQVAPTMAATNSSCGQTSLSTRQEVRRAHRRCLVARLSTPGRRQRDSTFEVFEPARAVGTRCAARNRVHRLPSPRKAEGSRTGPMRARHLDAHRFRYGGQRSARHLHRDMRFCSTFRTRARDGRPAFRDAPGGAHPAPVPVEPVVSLRPGAAAAGRLACGRRRRLQLQSDLCPGNDRGCVRSVTTTPLSVQGNSDLPRRFFKASAKPIRQAWQQAVGGDLLLPEIEGPPPPPIRLMNHYVDRILTAAEYDISVFEQFIRVAWLVDSPARMLRHDRAGDGGQASRTGRRTDSGAGLDVVLDVVAESAVQQLLRNAEHPADLAPRRPDRAGPSDRQSTTLFWSNVII